MLGMEREARVVPATVCLGSRWFAADARLAGERGGYSWRRASIGSRREARQAG